MHIQIATERLYLRALNLGDDHFIFNLLNTKGWLQNIGDRNVKNTEDARGYILRILKDPNCFYTVFQNKESPEPIGIVTLLYRETQDYPDIGFAILPEYEKKGYAYEAANAYLNEVLKTLDTEKILGITMTGNTSSIRLLERLGFRYENNMTKDNQDHFLFSRTVPGKT